MALAFTVLAGKYDDNEENIKFCNSADSMEDAQRMIQELKLYNYPICRVEVTGFNEAA